MEPWRLKSWSLPLIIIALLAPSAAGYAIGGPGVGMAVGAASVGTLIFLAVRSRRHGPIEVAAGAGPEPLLVLTLGPLEDEGLLDRIAGLAGPASSPQAIVLTPARGGTVQRWFSDVDQARFDAQRVLALSVANLAAVGVHAEGRVGDEEPVQAVEDLVYSQPIGALVAVGPGAELEEELERLRRRLDRPVHRLGLGGGRAV